MGGAPASTTWMDGQQINRVGGVTGPSQGMAGQGHWMGGGAGPTTGMAGQTYSAAAGGAVQRQSNKEEEDRVKLDRWMTKPVHKVRTMFPNIPILSIHHVIHLQCHPFTMSFIHHHGPCYPFTKPSIHNVIQSPRHPFTISSIHHVIQSPCHPFTMPSSHNNIN